jgi:uncharacterized protein
VTRARVALTCLVLALSAFAPTPAGATESSPAFSAPVVDTAKVVPDDVKREADAELIDYKSRTGNQVAVAVVKTTGNKSIEDYSIDLARKWGVGTKDRDNGVLLVIAFDDHKLRIEIGRGLEGTFTDIQAGRIIRDRIVPLLKSNDVGGAVLEGERAIRADLGDPNVGQLPPAAIPTNEQPRTKTPAWLYLLFPAAFGVFALFGRGRGRRHGWGWMPIYWGGGGFGGGGGGGGFGGGFGGGGGGGFGGGGASGGW